MILIFLASMAFSYVQQRRRTLSNMSLLASHTGEVIELTLWRDMLHSDFEGIQATMDLIGQDDRIRNVVIMDPVGRIVFSPGGEGVGQRLSNADPRCQPCHRLQPAERPSGVLVTDDEGEEIFRSMHPIDNREECSGCHDPNQQVIGLLLTDIPVAPFEVPLLVSVREDFLWWVATVALTGGLAYLALDRLVLRRLGGLASAIGEFARGARGVTLSEMPSDEIGSLSSAFNLMAENVEEQEAENRALSTTLRERAEERGKLLERVINAQEEERKRIARELHDELGQGLTSVGLSVQLAQGTIDLNPGDAREHLEHARGQVARSTDQMYEMILGLRPSSLDDLGLVAALRALCERVLAPAGISFEIDSGQVKERLPAELETVMFRIFQEALTNVVRHSGADHVQISIDSADGYVTGMVHDDGGGLEGTGPSGAIGEGKGLGLLGMRERAEMCGGELRIQSAPGVGTRVWVQIPLSGGPGV
jgi:signal transduction histidine kinase